MHLEKFPFYKSLKEDAKLFLKEHLQKIKITKDSILFYQGDICDKILFLTSGEVRLYIQSDEAEEITLYHLHPGEQCIVNTASTLSQTEAIANALALSDIEGYMLDMQSVKELAKMSESYQNFLFSIYTLRMGDLAKLINDIKFKKLDQRVLEWLHNQHTNEIKTTHETIANELGSTREVISKVLKRLEQQDLLTLKRGTILLM